MRFVLVIAVAVLVSVPSAFARDNDKVPDQQKLAAMETKAEQAKPKDQCYLYAKLVRAMSEVAGQQLDNGKLAEAANSLRAIRGYAAKIHVDVTQHSKKLKDAQIMVRKTAFRLQELLRGSDLNAQPELQATLNQLNQVQSQMMLAVFEK